MNIILSPADMLFPDQRSVVVYISLFYSFFCLKHPEQPPSPVVLVFVPTPDPVSCRSYKNICLFMTTSYFLYLFSPTWKGHNFKSQVTRLKLPLDREHKVYLKFRFLHQILTRSVSEWNIV